jgi:glycosyltransferase involved in cell wall biosynthesis
VQQSSITVGLPVYNAMPFLPEAIDSLFRQTVTNFQILVIVDGADEPSLRYLETIRDPRLLVLTQPHRGLTTTLNRMLREAETPWLVRQDADDISYPTRIERIQEEISRHPDAGMFYSLAEYYPPKRSLGLFRCSRGSPQQLRRIVQSGYLLSICHSSAVLHVEKTLAIGGYRHLAHAEDADLWWRMALRYDIRLIPEVLIGFRQNTSSVSSRNAYMQELHGIYIQYLLLSHLEGRDPLPLSAISPLLEDAIPATRLAAKQHLRHLNMHLAARRYGDAFSAFLRTVVTSPSYLIRRLKDEFFPVGIANGISPDLFHCRKEAFWP